MSGAACLNSDAGVVALPTPHMAFEFNETTGSTLYDTAPDSTLTATLNANVELFDMGSSRRGINWLNATHTGMDFGGTKLFCPVDAPWSIEACFKLTSFTDIAPTIIALNSGVSGISFQIAICNASNYFGVIHGAAGSRYARRRTGETVADANAFLNTLKHVVVTYAPVDNNGLTITNYKTYIDGVEVTTFVAGNFSTGLTNTSRIGSANVTNSQFIGQQDFVRYYQETLSASVVDALSTAAGV